MARIGGWSGHGLGLWLISAQAHAAEVRHRLGTCPGDGDSNGDPTDPSPPGRNRTVQHEELMVTYARSDEAEPLTEPDKLQGRSGSLFEERDPELCLQIGNRIADHRSSTPELSRGTRKAATVHDGQKGLQLI